MSSDKKLTNKQIYNVVADTVTGVNIRKKDNFYQMISVCVFVLLGAVIGVACFARNKDFFDMNRLAYGIAGGFVGMIVGIIFSGFLLMLFRAIMHFIGKHD
jgi:hypothetical protein